MGERISSLQFKLCRPPTLGSGLQATSINLLFLCPRSSGRRHFTNKSVTGTAFSIKSYSYSLSHFWTLWWRVRWLKQCSCLGYRHAGCLQLSHRRPPEMCGPRTRPRTDVDSPRFLLQQSNCHRRGTYHLATPGTTTCSQRFSMPFTLSSHLKAEFLAASHPAGMVHRTLHGWTLDTELLVLAGDYGLSTLTA